MAYRWTGSHAFRDHANNRVIEPGEVLPDDIAEQVAAAHPYDVEEIDEEERGGDSGDEDGEADADEVELPFDPTDLTVDDLEEELEDVGEIDVLEAISGAEEAGENRTTAQDAIDERIAAVAE